ncbi:DUF5692 family protein [Cryobacterium cryoconiti]|uniref:Uncharacterized protein n=1 Tax=Cryobacterium cryoconiti TaxID=1259239 RepID=A0A4Y8JUL7_9MICO|nr:DUF5692 family protein [Cryobacterium cryoconiti]TFD28025.1 hypothetical protein E3T49_12465 [Cryobacterium cryoconiti]
MFLFDTIPWSSTLMWVAVVAGLMIANEVARSSKWASLALFIALPVALTIFVWPTTAGAGSSTGTWFHWVKVYSALAGCLGFMAIRFIPRLAKNRYALMFPAFILALNIFEAVIRDFQVYGLNGMVDGVFMVGGPWNIMNGIAGLLNLLTICGWAGIIISRGPKKDMIWPDMLWFWIIAYDLWNFAYVYNAVGDHSFYAGAALLVSCTIPAFFIKRGAWLQHRAQTLAFWMMFTMAFPTFVSSSQFAVKSSHDPVALFWVSAVALAANIAVVIYQIYTIVKRRRNPLTDELFTHLPAYHAVLDANKPLAPVAAAAAGAGAGAGAQPRPTASAK